MEKILLIGENEPFLETIAEEFGKLGFKAFTAGEEDEGLKIITTEIPDVILLTHGIKRFNPLKLIFKLRESNLLAKLVYLHPEDMKPNPPDNGFYIFIPDSLSPDLIVTKIIEAVDNINPIGEMTIKDVLWLLNFEKQSAFIRIFTDEAEGEIIVKDGEPISCKLGIDVGDEALSSLVNLDTIAYEISWEIPEDVERNVTEGIEHFIGMSVLTEKQEKLTGSEEVKDFEDISKELEKDIEELTPGQTEEFSLNEFPSFEEETPEETWDIGEFEELGKDEEEKKEEKPEEEDLSSLLGEDLFKEEEKEEETPQDTFSLEEPEIPQEFEFPEEIKFEEETPQKEESIPEEQPLEQKPEEQIPGLDELITPPIEEKEETPPEEIPAEPAFKAEETPQIEEEFKEKVEEPAEVAEITPKFSVKVDDDLQKNLETVVTIAPGLLSAIIIRGNDVVSYTSEKDIEELQKFSLANIDEGYFKSGEEIFVLVKSGDFVLIVKWRHSTPGYALYMTRKIFKEIQS